MRENEDIVSNGDRRDDGDIYSKVVRAGRRTYFFDVKTTRADDWYLIITESRKMEGPNGIIYYEKHKIHLYKEDFHKYLDGFKDAIEYINVNRNGKASANGYGSDEDDR